MRSIAKVVLKIDNYKEGVSLLVNEPICGELLLTPKKDLPIKSLELKLVAEARGKFKTYTHNLRTQKIETDSLLKADIAYVFPFNFTNKNTATYYGKNADFLIKLEFELIVDNTKTDKNEPSILPKWNFSKFIFKEKKYTELIYLQFAFKENKYKVLAKTYKTKLDYSTGCIYLIGIGVLLGILGALPGVLLFMAILLLIVLVACYILMLNSLLGEFSFKTDNLELDQFKQQVYNSKKWKHVAEINARYEVREEVTDRRGTSDTIFDELLYKSDEQHLKNPNNDVDFIFDFPINPPPSIEIQSSRIYWKSIFKVRSNFGFTIVYEGEFITLKK